MNGGTAVDSGLRSQEGTPRSFIPYDHMTTNAWTLPLILAPPPGHPRPPNPPTLTWKYFPQTRQTYTLTWVRDTEQHFSKSKSRFCMAARGGRAILIRGRWP